jgi:hypothetical protein
MTVLHVCWRDNEETCDTMLCFFFLAGNIPLKETSSTSDLLAPVKRRKHGNTLPTPLQKKKIERNVNFASHEQ